MAEAKSVELAEIPHAGNDLEDYVAALFQASGYYIEKNLVERAPDEILELDIVATYYTGAPPASILVEAKGGKWGYPDIFKVAGWMRYLNQSQGAFFVKGADKDLESVRIRVAPLSISVVNLGDFTNPIELFESAGLGTPSGADAVHLWRYSNLAERKLMSYLLAYAKSKPDAQGPRAIVEYHRLVNDGIFFTQTIATQSNCCMRPTRVIRNLVWVARKKSKVKGSIQMRLGAARSSGRRCTTVTRSYCRLGSSRNIERG